ncbi:hypothetical protein P7C71_g3232, partial [Lecanoromycetidae sp. Uapishka_2]
MAQCVACSKPLTLFIEPEVEDTSGSVSSIGSYVNDDVQLQCGCHFHWSVRQQLMAFETSMANYVGRQCLLDAYSMTECPKCGTDLVSITDLGEQQLLCTLKNEGGLQDNLDILPILSEESYLKAYPEERRCRAFLEFCGEGDVEAIVDLLDNSDEDDEEDGGTNMDTIPGESHRIDVLRYQDQIGSMGTGLHVAIQNSRVQVVWLLLFLASSLEIGQFPQEILEAAQDFDLSRDDQIGKVDIRNLKDAEGLTAEQRAARVGGVWIEWLQSGRLRSPGN